MQSKTQPDHNNVFDEFGDITCTYLDNIPTPSKPCRPQDGASSRSPSVATHSRSTSPLVSATGTPIMRIQSVPPAHPADIPLDPQLTQLDGNQPTESNALGLHAAPSSIPSTVYNVHGANHQAEETPAEVQHPFDYSHGTLQCLLHQRLSSKSLPTLWQPRSNLKPSPRPNIARRKQELRPAPACQRGGSGQQEASGVRRKD
ncbi:hypothetical protein FRC12_003170 [Ceratobasidium sp. 428]|nr:hypothetical protein FRC12_003170 [Ceratobasidium sp. 428]